MASLFTAGSLRSFYHQVKTNWSRSFNRKALRQLLCLTTTPTRSYYTRVAICCIRCWLSVLAAGAWRCHALAVGQCHRLCVISFLTWRRKLQRPVALDGVEEREQKLQLALNICGRPFYNSACKWISCCVCRAPRIQDGKEKADVQPMDRIDNAVYHVNASSNVVHRHEIKGPPLKSC